MKRFYVECSKKANRRLGMHGARDDLASDVLLFFSPLHVDVFIVWLGYACGERCS